jgi:hypothetical protein
MTLIAMGEGWKIYLAEAVKKSGFYTGSWWRYDQQPGICQPDPGERPM